MRVSDAPVLFRVMILRQGSLIGIVQTADLLHIPVKLLQILVLSLQSFESGSVFSQLHIRIGQLVGFCSQFLKLTADLRELFLDFGAFCLR
jgi:hypothetical protein